MRKSPNFSLDFRVMVITFLYVHIELILLKLFNFITKLNQVTFLFSSLTLTPYKL